MTFATFLIWFMLTFGAPTHCYENAFDEAADFCVTTSGQVVTMEENR